MKRNIIVAALVIILGVAIWFMASDWFKSVPGESDISKNPFEYNIDEYKRIDESEICYSETNTIDIPLEEAVGLAVDSNDNIYVSGAHKIVYFSANGQLLKNKEIGYTANCLHFDDKQILYAGFNTTVITFDSEMEKIKQWDNLGEKAIITSITSNDTLVYVADAGNKQIAMFNKNGELLQTIDGKGENRETKGFIIPSGYFDIAFDIIEQLWVVNPGLHRFENIRNDGSIISSWQNSSIGLDGFSGCCNPTHFAFLPNGSVVTSEKGLVRIKIHYPNGDYKCVVAKPAQFDEGTTGLDLAVDSKERIIVLDPSRLQVRIFETKNQ